MSLADLSRSEIPTSVKVIKKASDFPAVIDSTIEYIIDGVIDMSGVSIEVPSTGFYASGHNFDVSQLVCSDDNYTMFTSPIGGSGNILFRDFSIETSGANSKAYGLVGATGNEAIELEKVNYNNCTSLGVIDDYRQYLEVGTGRFGGTPELTFEGPWGGARISTSIVRGLSNLGALFKKGASLTFSGRFITDINCDLPVTGALLDFEPGNFTNDESLVLQGAYISRQGALNPSDTGLTPNINQDSIKSNWDSNSGLANTTRYIKGNCSAEVLTPIALINTYYPLLGAFTIEKQTHFDMPANGEFRALTGAGDYLVSGNISITGTANDVVDIRVTKSTDSGATWPTEISHISRVVNNIVGARDVAFFPISFIANLSKNDRVRLEVENKTGANSITMELDSFFIVSEL